MKIISYAISSYHVYYQKRNTVIGTEYEPVKFLDGMLQEYDYSTETVVKILHLAT